MNTCKELAPDDLEVGMMVTVIRAEKRHRFLGGFGETQTAVKTEDRSWQGDVLEIMAISLPFVAVKNRSECALLGDRAIDIDTRTRILGLLDAGYVEAMRRDDKGENR